MAVSALSVRHRVGFLPGLLASCVRPVGRPHSVRPGAPPCNCWNSYTGCCG